MSSRRMLSVCLVGSLLGLGCAAQPTLGTQEVSVHDFVFGAFGGRSLDLREICKERAVDGFELRRSGRDYLFSFVSLGMYTPHRVRVRCSRGAP